MKKIWITLLLTLSFLSSTAIAEASKQSTPVMKITDIHGKTYEVKGTENGLNIEGLKGKVVFLEFFGHNCPPCLASIPHLINLQKKHKDKLAVIGVEVQGYNRDQLAQFAKQKGINYTVVSNRDAGELVDYVAQRAQWRGSIPFLVAMDTSGNVQFVQAGMLPESSLEALISQLSTPTQTKESNTSKTKTEAKNK